MNVQRYYPHQGSKRFETTSGAITKSFRIAATTQGQTTDTTETFPKGAMILGFQVKVTIDVAGTSSTVQMGFTGTEMLSAAIAEATLVPGYVFGAALGNDDSGGPLTLSADDTFDCIVATSETLSHKEQTNQYQRNYQPC